jgi:predicted dehydrogenase
MKKIRVALIGSGFVAAIHADALRKVYGVDVELAVCVSPRHAGDFAARHRIPAAIADYREVLHNPEIDVVDICTPNQLHPSMVLAAAQAGKHIICEKPLTGYFGAPPTANSPGEPLDHTTMLPAVRQELAEIKEAISKAGVGFAYAENWVYAPPISKAKQVLATTGGTILSQRAEESHSGSHAAYATEWRSAGGGSLLRLGAHPVGSVIHMKHYEGGLKGKPIHVQSVTGETARLIDLPGVAAEAGAWFKFKPHDVEDWANAILTFSDGTKALIVASDTILGGVRNTHALFMSRGVIECNMNPSNTLMLYTPDAGLLGDEYVAEKVETKGGWQYAAPDEDWIRGYHHEMQDFMECFSLGREPVSGLQLACETVETIYAVYLSAALGRRVAL